MHPYAQTITYLYSQLSENKYSVEDINLISRSYELSKNLFTGRFQPSGKDFLSHCIGTASIIASLNQPAKLISAALIHNAYQNGDFGSGKKFISKSKQRYVRNILGNEVEEYISKFAAMRWNSETVLNIQSCIDKLSSVEKDVLLLRLADILEHLLDLDVLYYTVQEKERYTKNISIFINMAEKIGYPDLAEMLALYYSEVNNIKLIPGTTNFISTSYMVTSPIYTKKILITFSEKARNLYSKMKQKY